MCYVQIPGRLCSSPVPVYIAYDELSGLSIFSSPCSLGEREARARLQTGQA